MRIATRFFDNHCPKGQNEERNTVFLTKPWSYSRLLDPWIKTRDYNAAIGSNYLQRSLLADLAVCENLHREI